MGERHFTEMQEGMGERERVSEDPDETPHNAPDDTLRRQPYRIDDAKGGAEETRGGFKVRGRVMHEGFEKRIIGFPPDEADMAWLVPADHWVDDDQETEANAEKVRLIDLKHKK